MMICMAIAKLKVMIMRQIKNMIAMKNYLWQIIIMKMVQEICQLECLEILMIMIEIFKEMSVIAQIMIFKVDLKVLSLEVKIGEEDQCKDHKIMI